jgi:hypothetical protein
MAPAIKIRTSQPMDEVRRLMQGLNFGIARKINEMRGLAREKHAVLKS